MAKTKVLLWLGLLLGSFNSGAAQQVNQIRFEGNHVTRESVLLREIYIAPGDPLDQKLIEKSRQAIMDLGLFKKVYFHLEDYIQPVVESSGETASKSTDVPVSETKGQATLGYKVNVVFVVEEKYYFLVLPRLRSEGDEFYYGMQVRWDNVMGRDHEMELLLEDRGKTQGVDEHRLRFNYFYQNVLESPYNIDFEWQDRNEVDEDEGIVTDRQDEDVRVTLSRWLNEKGRHRGWLIGGSVNKKRRFNEVISGFASSENVEANILGFNMLYTSVSDFEFNRGGKSYSYEMSVSDERLGSNSEFTRHLFTYRSYYRVDANPLSNLNVQTRLGHSNSLILGKKAFSLGSSDDLRGYENDRFKGNTMFLTNIEYMFPHKDYPIIRYVYFVDLGNTYDRFEDIIHKPLNIGIGVGLRWKIRAFVKLDLRADAGYGLTDEDYRFSFGTRHAF